MVTRHVWNASNHQVGDSLSIPSTANNITSIDEIATRFVRTYTDRERFYELRRQGHEIESNRDLGICADGFLWDLASMAWGLCGADPGPTRCVEVVSTPSR
jgi:hypothetical protein